MIYPGPSTSVNRKCDPPYIHDEECLCAEKEAEESEDFMEGMLDRLGY